MSTPTNPLTLAEEVAAMMQHPSAQAVCDALSNFERTLHVQLEEQRLGDFDRIAAAKARADNNRMKLLREALLSRNSGDSR